MANLTDVACQQGPMIDHIFIFESTRQRQRNAPLLKEREKYLSYLVGQGTSLRRARTVAAMLLNIIRILDLQVPRVIDIEEIKQASQRWVVDTGSRRTRPPGENSVYTFVYTAERWFKFLGLLSETAPRPFDTTLNEFIGYLKTTRKLSSMTVTSCHSRIGQFLQWIGERGNVLSRIGISEVDEFLEFKRRSGCKPRTMASFLAALHLFSSYTQHFGLTKESISKGIQMPRIPRYETVPKGPRWDEVRRVLDDCANGKTPADLRAAAIFSLCAIYAIRRIEIVNLQLTDFDWHKETFVARRAKNGRVQQFPLQFEVGEAILRYLKYGRPRCSSRHLFVTLKPPYRQMNPAVLWVIIAARLKEAGVESEHFGAHALRHSCATYLLRQGSSLKDIADFLGHTGMKSVCIYAKYDMNSLREVADFSLAGIE